MREFLKSQNANNSTNTAARNTDSNILNSPSQNKQDNSGNLDTATNDSDVASIASWNYNDLAKEQLSEQKSYHENDETTDTQQETTDTSDPILAITKNLTGTEIEHPVAEDMSLNINSSERLTANNSSLNKLSRSLTGKDFKEPSLRAKKVIPFPVAHPTALLILSTLMICSNGPVRLLTLLSLKLAWRARLSWLQSRSFFLSQNRNGAYNTL